MVVRMLPKLTILLFITSITISAVLSGIPDIKDTKLPKKFQDPLKLPKNDFPSPLKGPGRRLRPPPKKLGAPEPPSLPQNHEAPINLMIKDLPPPPQKDALKNNNKNSNTKDLKTDNSYAYYSYWDWPYYYYYWPYYYYGLGYKYKYSPLYTSYWGKWNNYYAYPYYSYYDHYYYDEDDDDDDDYYDNYYYWYRRR